MNISKNITLAREKAGKTLDDMAQLLGFESRQAYYRLEKRGEKLSIEQLKAIANALDIDIRDILLEPENQLIKTQSEYIEALERNYEMLLSKFDDTAVFHQDLINILQKDPHVIEKIENDYSEIQKQRYEEGVNRYQKAGSDESFFIALKRTYSRTLLGQLKYYLEIYSFEKSMADNIKYLKQKLSKIVTKNV